MAIQDTFRVTHVEYEVGELATDNEYSTQHVIVLPHDLKPDYLVMISSANEDLTTQRPDRMAFQVTHDPFGTGDLSKSGSSRTIVVESGVAVARRPMLHMTIIECLNPYSPDGFILRDVINVTHAAGSASGAVTTTHAVSGVVDVNKCTVHGIQSGWGMTTQGSGSTIPNLMYAAEHLSSATELTIERYSPFGSSSGEADGFTSVHGVIEWGTNWDVNRYTGSASGGNAASVTASGQQILALGFDYTPNKTMFFPSFSSQNSTDDVKFTEYMLVPHDASIIHSVGEVVSPGVVKNSVAICSWANGVPYKTAIHAVSHPSIDVQHILALANTELGSPSNPDTVAVALPSNGAEVYSDGVLGSNIWVGERALSSSIQGEATNTTDDNASLLIGLHYEADGAVKFHGVSDHMAGSKIDLMIQSVDFGGLAMADAVDSNDGTVGQRFIFPDQGTVVDSATSEKGLGLGSSPLISGTGGLIAGLSGNPSSALDATARIELAGDVGKSRFSWKNSSDSNYSGADHTLFPWGSRSCFGEKEADRVDACYSRVLGEAYYAVADATDVTNLRVKVYKMPQGSAVYSDESLVDTIQLEFPVGGAVDDAYDQVIEFGIAANGTGDLFVLTSHHWRENHDLSTELLHEMNVHKMTKGESSFVKIASDITSGQDALGVTSLRLAASGSTLKAVWLDQSGAVISCTSVTNGGSWSRRIEGTGAIPGGVDTGPTVVSSSVRLNDEACHDLVGMDDNSGTFYYAYCYEVTITGTDYFFAVSKSVGSSALVPVMGLGAAETLSVDQQPQNVAAAWHDNGLLLGAVFYSKKSTKETSVMGFIDYNPDFSVRATTIGDKYEDTSLADGGAIQSGMQFCSMSHMRMLSVGARLDVHFSHIDPSSTSDCVMASKFSLGGWTTHPITNGLDSRDSSALNPLSIAYWSSTMGAPTSYSTNAGAGQAWTPSGIAAETLDAQQYGSLRIFPSTVNTRRYKFTSHEGLGNAFGYKNGFCGGFTVKPSKTPVSYYAEAAGTNAVTSDGWKFRVFVDSTNGIVFKTWDTGTSAYVDSYTHGTVDDSKYYQIIVSVDGDLNCRISHRCLSDVGEHSSWETSGVLAAGDDGEEIYGSLPIDGVIGPLGGNNAEDSFEFGSEVKLALSEFGVIAEAWGTAQGDNLPSMLGSSSLNGVEMEVFGKRTSANPVYVHSGISVDFRGAGAYEGDIFELNTRTHFQKENALERSPRIAWRSTGTTEQSLAMSHEASGHVSTHGGIALFNTNFRTAIVEYSSSSGFSSIAATHNLSADITGDMTVSAKSGNRITLSSGHGMTQGEHKGRWVVVVDGSAAGEVYEVLSHPTDDSLSVSSPGAVSAGDRVVVFGSSMSSVYSDVESYEFFRVRVPAQNAVLGYFQIGTLVAGPVFNPGNVPLDWSISENDDPQVEEISTYSGIEWSFLKGPVRRSVAGRFVGDVDRKRESFRSMVRGLCGYSEKPLAFLMANTSEMTILGVVKSGLSLESEGWYQDANGKWRLAGDLGITIEEVV